MRIKAIQVDRDRIAKTACNKCGHETESVITDDWDQHLTIDKEYEVEGESSKHYMIRNDAGTLQWFFKKKFDAVSSTPDQN